MDTKHAIAIYTFLDEDATMPQRVAQFAARGFDAVSLQQHQVDQLDAAQQAELVGVVNECALAVTMHEQVRFTTPERIARSAELFGDHLVSFTLDTLYRETSIGQEFDARRLVEVLQTAASRTGRNVRLAIEDFPLDARALEHYQADLGDLLRDPRYGILLDMGHMNIRRQQADYYRAHSVADYLRRVPLEIIEIHLHDNAGAKDTHQPLGQGNLSLPDVTAGLHAVGFTGMVTVEIAPRMYDALPRNCVDQAVACRMRWQAAW